MKKIFLALIVGTLVLGLSGVAMTAVITFDEYPVGTVIDNQYSALGVVFLPGTITTYLPVISWDGAMPTGPVLRPQGELAGNYLFQGDFWIEFTTPAGQFSFVSGYWDSVGSGIIGVYDASNNLLADLSNTGTGVQTISYAYGGGIKKINFNSIADGAGADIDNLQFTPVPEPTTMLLLASGLIGLVGYGRKKFFKK